VKAFTACSDSVSCWISSRWDASVSHVTSTWKPDSGGATSFVGFGFVATSTAAEEALSLTLQGENPNQWRNRNLAGLRVRSLLRLKQFDKAESDAAVLGRQFRRPSLQAIAAAGRGDLDRALKFALDGDVTSDSVCGDNDESGELFLSSRFHRLHEKHPVTDFGLAETVAIFTLHSPLQLDVKTVQSALGELRASSLPLKVTSLDDKKSTLFLVEAGDATIWCRVGSGRIRPQWTLQPLPPDTDDAVNSAKGYLTVGVAGLTFESCDELRGLARELGHKLASGNATAFIAFSDSSSWWSAQLLRFDDPQMPQWIETGSVDAFQSPGLRIFQQRNDSDVVANRHFDKTLQKTLLQFESPETGSLQILLHLGNEDCIEPLWLDVQKTDRNYGSFLIKGSLTDTSKLIPSLRRDLPVSVYYYSVQGWRSGTDEPVIRP
jgi:hypothetical protein